MAVIGHGVDLVEVRRIAEMIERHGERFLDRCFTENERRYAESSRRRDEHLAARFAAKEAVLKALGAGWRNGITWTDVEVTVKPSGEPRVRLSGQAGRIAADLGAEQWRLSLSHTGGFALASVIAETTPEPQRRVGVGERTEGGQNRRRGEQNGGHTPSEHA